MAEVYDILRQGLYDIPVKIKNEHKHFTFLRDVLFGGTPIMSSKDFIAMDYQQIGVKLSDEAVKGADPNRVNYGTSFNEKLIYPRYYFDEDTLNFANAKNRVSMDEPINAPWNMMTRLQYLAADKRNQMARNRDITEEKLCSDVLLTGSFDTKKHGLQTYPMQNSLLHISGAEMLTNPVKTIAHAVKEVLKHGSRPVSIIFNPDDSLALAESAKWQAMLDNKRVEGNAIAYKPIESNGLAYVGTISVQGGGILNVYTYMGTYPKMDDAGTVIGEEYLIPQGKALLVPERVGCMGYGGLLVNNGSGFQEQEAMREGYYIYDQPKGALVQTFLQFQTSPAPIIEALDGYGVIENIPTA